LISFQKKEKAVRFSVRSLGWVKIAEEDLTPERSSRAVNKCIVDLTLGRNDINDLRSIYLNITYISPSTDDIIDIISTKGQIYEAFV
jgi:hypothetical protein